MLKQRIAQLLQEAAAEAQKRGLLPPVSLPDVGLEHPQNPEHGDYASSLALRLARAAGMSPIKIAENLAGLMSPNPEIESIAVAPPGFINFTLRGEWLARQVEPIIGAGDGFGDSDLGKGSRIQVEFVSVNPTGPLHVGHGRGAVLGSTLARVLASAGYSVEKEYYINDAGTQIDTFGRSLFVRYREALGAEIEMPADGYFGAYMSELAREIIAAEGVRYLDLPETEALAAMGKKGTEMMISAIEGDLKLLGVEFDVWFREQSLYDEGKFQRVMEILKEAGYTGEREGATWFVSTALGESKDNVLMRSVGTPTYFASDIAYHYNKFLERGFDQVIDIWGADHQGHVSRMKAMASALGIDPGRLHIIISQMVTLRRGDEIVKASKRSGDLVALREVVDEVGADVCRFFFLSRSADSQMDFDLELAKKQSADNPVYYVQYAYARIASIMRLARERGITYRDGDVALLNSEPELALIRKMLLLPELIELITDNLEPHHLTYYASDLATSFHSFYDKCRVISDDENLNRARLKLVEAAQIVLAKSLRLMGMNTPERM